MIPENLKRFNWTVYVTNADANADTDKNLAKNNCNWDDILGAYFHNIYCNQNCMRFFKKKKHLKTNKHKMQ